MSKYKIVWIISSSIWGIGTGLLTGLAIKGIISIVAAVIGLVMVIVFFHSDYKLLITHKE
jgi:uncharacterized membrane protein (Fun14 family)